MSISDQRSKFDQLTHPLTTDDISQPTEKELSNQGTDGGGDFDAEVLVGAQLTTCENDERCCHNGWAMLGAHLHRTRSPTWWKQC